MINRRRSSPPRLAAVALAALFLGGVCGGTSACGAVHSDCTSVAMAAGPVHAAAPYGNLAIAVSVTAGGKPVAGVPVNFWVKETGTDVPADYSESIGSEKTDAAGTARVARSQGFFGLLLPGRTVTGYYAALVPGTKVAGVTYCARQTPVQPLSCGTGSTCGPMPPLSQGAG